MACAMIETVVDIIECEGLLANVRKLSQQAGIGMPEVAIFEGAPNAFATWMADVPMPPAAPCTSTRSPSASRPRSTSAKEDVR